MRRIPLPRLSPTCRQPLGPTAGTAASTCHHTQAPTARCNVECRALSELLNRLQDVRRNKVVPSWRVVHREGLALWRAEWARARPLVGPRDTAALLGDGGVEVEEGDVGRGHHRLCRRVEQLHRGVIGGVWRVVRRGGAHKEQLCRHRLLEPGSDVGELLRVLLDPRRPEVVIVQPGVEQDVVVLGERQRVEGGRRDAVLPALQDVRGAASTPVARRGGVGDVRVEPSGVGADERPQRWGPPDRDGVPDDDNVGDPGGRRPRERTRSADVAHGAVLALRGPARVLGVDRGAALGGALAPGRAAVVPREPDGKRGLTALRT
eukprot:m.13712 g.13712  ORF g.13712 m.13712 type:complete len:320 (+) comp8216_c0_seq1:306-1265(+)